MTPMTPLRECRSAAGVSVCSTLGRFDLTGLEQPERTLADVRELVGHDRVEARFIEGELDESTL